MGIEDELCEEEIDNLVNQLDKEENREEYREEHSGIVPGLEIEYVPEDFRAIPCSPTDIEAVNRALNEQYFGKYHQD